MRDFADSFGWVVGAMLALAAATIAAGVVLGSIWRVARFVAGG